MFGICESLVRSLADMPLGIMYAWKDGGMDVYMYRSCLSVHPFAGLSVSVCLSVRLSASVSGKSLAPAAQANLVLCSYT